MYVRQINGREHTFGVSGKLIMNALVMYDHQTRTLWSQFLGQGVKGELTGVKLDFVPVTHTTWTLWRQAHPDTLVLDKKGGYRSDAYDGYYRSGAPGVVGESVGDKRLARKELVVGVDVDGHAKAYPLRRLADQPLVHDTVGDEEILVYLERETETALVYNRTVDGRGLTFRILNDATGYQALLEDEETGTKWLALTGHATEGPLAGHTLTRTPSHLAFWFAWTDWNPDAALWQG